MFIQYPLIIKIGKGQVLYVPKWYQSLGMDQRVEQLEQNVTSLLTNQQQMLEKITELFTKLSSFNSHREEGESSHGQPRGSHNQWGNRGSQQGETNQSYAPRLAKLDFPRFNGSEDPTSWICRAEQFFRFHETPLEDQDVLASFHLEGEARLWYQLLQHGIEFVTWEVFKVGLLAHYGPTQFHDFFGELTKFQQMVLVREYQS